MKKGIKNRFMVFVLAVLLLLPVTSVQAGTISTVSATGADGSITVSGTAGDGVLAVAVLVYDSTGTNLIKMKSVSINDSHAYTDTIAVSNGTYVVKVADYEGGAFSTTTVTAAKAETGSGGDDGTKPGGGSGDTTKPGGDGKDNQTNGTTSNQNSSNQSSSASVNSGKTGAKIEAPKTGDADFVQTGLIAALTVSGLVAGTILISRKRK